MSSNLSEEWANAKDLCNKLPDKSVSICTHLFTVHCNERCISQSVIRCIALHCFDLWFDRQLSDPSCRHSLALKPVDIRHKLISCACSPPTFGFTPPEPTFVPYKALSHILCMFSLTVPFQRTKIYIQHEPLFQET